MTSGLPKKSIFRGKPQKRVVKNLKFYSRIIPDISDTGKSYIWTLSKCWEVNVLENDMKFNRL